MDNLEKKTDGTADLVRRAKKHDQDAISDIYRLTYSSVYHIARALIKDEDAALDIIQDAYVKAFTHLDQLENPEKLTAWLKLITTNTARDWLKKNKPVLFTDMATKEQNEEGTSFEDTLEDKKEGVIPEDVVDDQETKRLIMEILQDLPEDQRMVIGMFYYEDMSVRDIADTLEVSENTVKSRLNYGRKKIKEAVLTLEKRGTKLYGLAAVPFLCALFGKLDAHAAEIPNERVLGAVLKTSCAGTAGGTVAAHTAGISSSVHGVATSSAVHTAGAAATKGTAVKIAAATAASAIAVGGISVFVYTNTRNNEKAQVTVEEETPLEESAAVQITEKVEAEQEVVESEEESVDMTQVYGFLDEAASACSAGDYDSVFALMTTDQYAQAIAIVDEQGDITAYDAATGKIGIYKIDPSPYGDHMIYYGDYDGTLRTGNGLWIGYDLEDKYTYAEGQWSDDMPNGHQIEYAIWSGNEDIYEGTVISGLWDGQATLTVHSGEHVSEFNEIEFNHGIFVTKGISAPWPNDNTTHLIVSEGTYDGGRAELDIPEDQKNWVNGLAGYSGTKRFFAW